MFVCLPSARYLYEVTRILQYSTPTRIAEAAPYLERFIANFGTEHPNGKVDVTPEIYLGVVLHKVLGQEDAAVSHFRVAYMASSGIKMQLWSWACFSRLLRCINRIPEAEEQEDAIRFVDRVLAIWSFAC